MFKWNTKMTKIYNYQQRIQAFQPFLTSKLQSMQLHTQCKCTLSHVSNYKDYNLTNAYVNKSFVWNRLSTLQLFHVQKSMFSNSSNDIDPNPNRECNSDDHENGNVDSSSDTKIGVLEKSKERQHIKNLKNKEDSSYFLPHTDTGYEHMFLFLYPPAILGYILLQGANQNRSKSNARFGIGKLFWPIILLLPFYFASRQANAQELLDTYTRDSFNAFDPL